jgi:hypothetical protein
MPLIEPSVLFYRLLEDSVERHEDGDKSEVGAGDEVVALRDLTLSTDRMPRTKPPVHSRLTNDLKRVHRRSIS